jgi:hypothetical protein
MFGRVITNDLPEGCAVFDLEVCLVTYGETPTPNSQAWSLPGLTIPIQFLDQFN